MVDRRRPTSKHLPPQLLRQAAEAEQRAAAVRRAEPPQEVEELPPEAVARQAEPQQAVEPRPVEPRLVEAEQPAAELL